MLTVFPRFVVALALLVGRASAGVRTALACQGLLTLAFTAGPVHAGRVGEIAITVDPFDMASVPFQAIAGLSLLYTGWTSETWQLTCLWWARFAVATTAILWPEIAGLGRRLLQRLPDAIVKRDLRPVTYE